MMHDDERTAELQALETEIELLALEQIDLLAQVEAQFRADHQAMREMLRGLCDEIHLVNARLAREHECCRAMQANLEKLQRLARQFRAAHADRTRTTSPDAA